VIFFSWLDHPTWPSPRHIWGFKTKLRQSKLGRTSLV